MHVKGGVFLQNDFRAQGQVRLLRAEIGGVLSCICGAFENPKGDALSCDGMRVQGDVFMRNGFQAKGEVRLPGAEIDGQLDCSGGLITGDFIGQNMQVSSSFIWRKLKEKPAGQLNLSGARLSNLVDDEASWPAPGKLNVDGLVYGPFSSVVSADAKSRLRWLGLQDQSVLTVQPYEQLAAVFRQMGLRDDARAVAVAKQRHIRTHLRGWSRVGSWIQDATIGYGYYPWRVLFFILPLLLMGALIFGWGFAHGLMVPTIDNPQFALFTAQAQAPSAHLAWDAFAYSLDVFLPIVDLHQESAWAPDAAWVQYYQYFHILMGWVLTTLGVAGFTGLVRND
jgi:hypothetical protein